MLAYFLVFLGAFLRVIPHPANFAPIAAIALFGGTYLNKKLAIVLPLAAMIISDYFIGFDSVSSRLTVYGSFVLIGLLGFWLRKKRTTGRIAASSLAGSVIFYLITNFAFLYPTTMYSHDWTGVVASYINALPFFRNTLLGDLFYVSLFFGLYEVVRFYKSNLILRSSKSQITNHK